MNIFGEQLDLLVRNLVLGNRKRARRLAASTCAELATDDATLAARTLVENLAQQQALKNAAVNSPSIFPGIGTLISFGLLGVENFLMLDQSVTLILAICVLHDRDEEDGLLADFVIRVLGEAYGVVEDAPHTPSGDISERYATRILPEKVATRGINTSINRLSARMFPLRRQSRLLPVGFGLVVSGLDGYRTLTKVGDVALQRLPDFLEETGDAQQTC